MTIAIYTALLVAALVAPLLVVACSFPSAPQLIDVPGAQRIALREGVVRFEDQGTGPHALLLLHGFNSQLGYWNDAWNALANGERKVRIDIPGFGGSDFDADNFDLDSQVQRLCEFLDARGIERVTIVAESMGGSLAAQLAVRQPQRVAAMALLAPSGYTGSLRYGGMRGLLMRPGPLKDAATKIAGWSIYRMLFPHSKALQGLTVTYSYGPAWVAILPRIKAPTLLLWSRGDYGVSYTNAPDVMHAIPGSRLLWLDKSTGHLISQLRPQLVANLAGRLLAGESPAAIAATPPRELLRDGESFD